MPHDALAIAIPTFNRPAILVENLRLMLPELRANSVPVHISDDSTDDTTERELAVLRREYEHLTYVRNRPGLGHDANCFATIAQPATRHVWYLGDSTVILPGVLGRVLRLLETDPDFIFLNTRVTGSAHLSEITPATAKGFLEHHAWHLTMSGVTIYGPGFRRWMVAHAQPHRFRNFPQLGMILEYILAVPGAFQRAYWHDEFAIRHHQDKRSYWRNNSIQVFAHDWASLIDEFSDQLDARTRDAIIRSHGAHTGLFGMRDLRHLRARGVLTPETLRQFRSDLLRASTVPPSLIWLIAHAPQGFVRAITTRGSR
jgi:glycosyltransferase involved in cell wall biosynthesis